MNQVAKRKKAKKKLHKDRRVVDHIQNLFQRKREKLIINLDKSRNADRECVALTANGHLFYGISNWFKLKSSVKQGCNMFGFLFLKVFDWIRKTNQSITSAKQILIESVKIIHISLRRNYPLKGNQERHENTSRPHLYNMQPTITCLEK